MINCNIVNRGDKMKAVLLAGGAGTRMKGLFGDLPKPMIPVCSTPVLHRQINVLMREGIMGFVIVIGNKGEVIKNYFGDGSEFGTEISYYYESEPLGTAGALFRLGINEDFLLCGGDLIFDFSLSPMLTFHKKSKALATLLAHPNSHPYDSTCIVADSDGKITGFIGKEDSGHFAAQNLCNAGVQIVSPKLLEMYNIKGKADFDKDIIRPAVKSGRIYAYKTYEYVKDMGTPERLKTAERDIKNGIAESLNKEKKHRAVFLDRDGTINVYKGLITQESDIELLPGAAEAVKSFNSMGYLCIIITNQPVIARGDCSLQELKKIHDRLESLLGREGAYVDGIYFCPHHPESGFKGERSEYKTVCECRKPKPGLILKAADEFNVDIGKSFMVGDSQRDISAALNAGCVPVFVKCGAEDSVDGAKETYDSLLSFSRSLKQKENCYDI